MRTMAEGRALRAKFNAWRTASQHGEMLPQKEAPALMKLGPHFRSPEPGISVEPIKE